MITTAILTLLVTSLVRQTLMRDDQFQFTYVTPANHMMKLIRAKTDDVFGLS